MSEMVTYPSGEGGKNAISDSGSWAAGGVVPLLNTPGGRTEDRPFILRSITIESISISSVYELFVYVGEAGSEEQLFSQRFAEGQYPFTLPTDMNRVFPGGARITAKLMDSNGSGTIYFSIKYEADPGNVRAS